MQRLVARFIGGTLALALLAGTAGAQTPEGTWDIGLTAGVNVATISGNDTDDAEWRSDFMGGLSLNWGIGPTLSLQPELLYSRKGAKAEGGGTLKLGYIEVPVLVKFATGASTQMRPAFFFGPSIGFNVSCDESLSGSVSSDCGDDIKSTDFGVVGGIGFDVGAMGVFVRFTQGLTKLADDFDAMNRVITLGGRYSFGRR
jgi:hypothetical protein